jgi:hypothetical protein
MKRGVNPQWRLHVQEKPKMNLFETLSYTHLDSSTIFEMTVNQNHVIDILNDVLDDYVSYHCRLSHNLKWHRDSQVFAGIMMTGVA